MTFKGQVPIGSKTGTDNTILQEVNTFTYLGCKISYEEERDITSKLFTNFGNTDNVLIRHLLQRHSRLRVNNILAIPPHTYGCEIWKLQQRYKPIRRLKTVEIKSHERQSSIQFIRLYKK
jgi:hypothetical protein